MSENNIKEFYKIDYHQFVKMVFSRPEKESKYSKVIIRPVIVNKKEIYQAEYFKDNKAYHININTEDIGAVIMEIADPFFKNIDIFYTDRHVMVKKSKKGKVTVKTVLEEHQRHINHNREKHYILKEGLKIDPLVDLGIFTNDYRLIKAKSDKYKQINRFVEIIGDEIKNFKDEEITVLDFGCGKSYLTFILYFYLSQILNINAKIIGYDLKKDVVDKCNKIAEKYGYSQIKFVVGDVADLKMYLSRADMVITLHACNTATDHALCHAVKSGVKYIFSVPCCQHEINAGINITGPFDLLLKHGLIKERFSSLLTDAIRCEILKTMGYQVDVIEFVDFEHSPKNLMIRSKLVKQGTPLKENNKLAELIESIGTTQKLYELLK